MLNNSVFFSSVVFVRGDKLIYIFNPFQSHLNLFVHYLVFVCTPLFLVVSGVLIIQMDCSGNWGYRLITLWFGTILLLFLMICVD